MNEVFDWNGNEIKEGMIIYFVQTKPGFLESSRNGILIPQTGETIWEDEDEWQKRKNANIWELGEGMEVKKDRNTERLFVETITKGSGEWEGSTFHSKIDLLMQIKMWGELTIAIKGISDKK
jgi:hypothetical protein